VLGALDACTDLRGKRDSAKARRARSRYADFKPRTRDSMRRAQSSRGSVHEDDVKPRTIILGEAAALFRDRGYERTTLRDIAARVNMTGPALYWYFSSKADILFQYLDAGLENARRVVDAAVTADSPEERLRQFVTAHVHEQLRQVEELSFGALYGVDHLARYLPPAKRAHLVHRQREGMDKLRQILTEGVADGSFVPMEVGPVSLAIVTMSDYCVVWYRRGARLSAESLARLHGRLALRMVMARAKLDDSASLTV
jgi:AcrR family transcriptional regulator